MDTGRFIVFGFGFLLLIGSCSEPNARLDNRKVFHYNQSSGIQSLDPAFAKDQSGIWACTQLYNGLVQLDSNLNITPCIAKSWKISDDGMVYTFILRTDVQFHQNQCFAQGTRMVAASDFVYSFTRIMDSHTASPGAWIFNGKVDSTEPFRAINDSTFQLKLREPFRPMLGILTMPYCFAVPKEGVELYGADWRSHPVGTGAFRFHVWREGTALVLDRNQHYFERDGGGFLPYLDGIKVTFMDTKKTEFLSFKQGKLDFISGLDAAYIDEVINQDGDLKPELKNQFNLLKTPYLNTEYLGFLMENKGQKNPLNDKRVRLAINYGFDRRAMIQYLRNGVGKPAEQGFTPPGLPSFSSEIVGYNYNITKAKELLAQAGFPNGIGLGEIKLLTNETYKEYALYLSKQLEQLGLQIKVQIEQPAILRQWMSESKAGFFRGSWIADYPDAESYFAVFYSKNGSPPNYTRFNNAEYDRLYELSLKENEDAKRFELYHQLEGILLAEAPIVPLYYDEVLRFTQKNIKGLSPNAMNLLDLKRVKKE